MPRYSDCHWLASHLVRAPNSRSGGHEVESSEWQDLGALLKVETPWGQVFLQHAETRSGSVALAAWHVVTGGALMYD